MAGIKPAEVSEVLKKQLEGFKTTEELEEVGTVLQVGDGIARIYGLTGTGFAQPKPAKSNINEPMGSR